MPYYRCADCGLTACSAAVYSPALAVIHRPIAAMHRAKAEPGAQCV